MMTSAETIGAVIEEQALAADLKQTITAIDKLDDELAKLLKKRDRQIEYLGRLRECKRRLTEKKK